MGLAAIKEAAAKRLAARSATSPPSGPGGTPSRDSSGRQSTTSEHYTLLRQQSDGLFLASDGGSVVAQPFVDDSALWSFDLGSAFGSNYQVGGSSPPASEAAAATPTTAAQRAGSSRTPN